LLSLKGNPATKHVMVLMVTALNELGDIERGVEARTDDFISKPVNKLALIKRVETMFKLKDVQDENERLRRYIQEMEEQQRPK
jgi:response regulator RpfG family c-di-GMP phosphodiesterase